MTDHSITKFEETVPTDDFSDELGDEALDRERPQACVSHACLGPGCACI